MRRFGVALSLLIASCSGESLTEGATEPIRVLGAQFVPGDLPGSKPLTAQEIRNGKELEKPYSTTPEIAGRVLDPGRASVGISGRTTPDGYSVGLQLVGHGTGYWVFPVGAPDPFNNNELAWSARVDFGDIPPGLQYLRVVALDENQRAGTQRTLEFCIRSPLPDNLNACSPKVAPPRLVVSLEWESAGDVDLSVVTPSGEVLNYASITDGTASENAGKFTGDTGTGCLQIGPRRENIAWQEKPAKGLYYVYVNLHDACNELATPFVVTTHVRKQRGDEYELQETFRIASEALAVQANGGSQLGTFITEFSVD